MNCRRGSCPQSTLGKAADLREEPARAALRQSVSDGQFRSIDNNVSERTVLIQAIGRKNSDTSRSKDTGP